MQASNIFSSFIIFFETMITMYVWEGRACIVGMYQKKLRESLKSFLENKTLLSFFKSSDFFLSLSIFVFFK